MSESSNKWIERGVTLALIIGSAFSGHLVDKTKMEGKMTTIENRVDKLEDKLDEANLELILYRINTMETTMGKMEEMVYKLDEKIDASTAQILNSLNNRRR